MISILQENLNRALQIVSQAVPTKPSLPILSYIALIAEGNSTARLEATDLEFGISYRIGAKQPKSEREYGLTAPAKTFKDLVGALSKERVDIEFDHTQSKMIIACGDVKRAKLTGISLDEFPPLRQTAAPVVKFNRAEFMAALKNVKDSAATETNRPILNGIFVSHEQGKVDFVTADGYRLAVDRIILDNDWQHSTQNFVIPLKVAEKILKILKEVSDDTVELSLVDEYLLIQSYALTLQVKLLEGRFPDYTSIIPSKVIHTATMPLEDLEKAIKRSRIFAKDMGNIVFVRVNDKQSSVSLVGKSAERGTLLTEFTARVQGDYQVFAANAENIQALLPRIDAEYIVMGNNGHENPQVFTAEGKEFPKFLVMSAPAFTQEYIREVFDSV